MDARILGDSGRAVAKGVANVRSLAAGIVRPFQLVSLRGRLFVDNFTAWSDVGLERQREQGIGRAISGLGSKPV